MHSKTLNLCIIYTVNRVASQFQSFTKIPQVPSLSNSKRLLDKNHIRATSHLNEGEQCIG